MTPKTLKDCVNELDYIFSIQEKNANKENNEHPLNEFCNFSEDELIWYHHSLGAHLRDTCGLWDENSTLHKMFVKNYITHPDDMSQIIIQIYWKHKKGLSKNIDDSFKEYVDEAVVRDIIE